MLNVCNFSVPPLSFTVLLCKTKWHQYNSVASLFKIKNVIIVIQVMMMMMTMMMDLMMMMMLIMMMTVTMMMINLLNH